MGHPYGKLIRGMKNWSFWFIVTLRQGKVYGACLVYIVAKIVAEHCLVLGQVFQSSSDITPPKFLDHPSGGHNLRGRQIFVTHCPVTKERVTKPALRMSALWSFVHTEYHDQMYLGYSAVKNC